MTCTDLVRVSSGRPSSCTIRTVVEAMSGQAESIVPVMTHRRCVRHGRVAAYKRAGESLARAASNVPHGHVHAVHKEVPDEIQNDAFHSLLDCRTALRITGSVVESGSGSN